MDDRAPEPLPPDPGPVLFRVACGTPPQPSDRPLRIGAALWSADRDYLPEAAPYGALGGACVARIAEIRFLGAALPDLYRHERFGLEGYVFRVPDGAYTLRLHFAESFESVYQPGERVFDVSVGGRTALQNFDPFAEGGGFARPVVMEVRGARVQDGRLALGFQARKGAPAICGIEVFRGAEEDAFAVRKLTRPVPAPDFGRPLPGSKPLQVLFVGNSLFFFWALPETIAHMVNSGQARVQMETQRCLRGGKRLSWFWVDDPEKIACRAVARGGHDHVVLLVALETEMPWERGLEILDEAMALARKHGAQPVLHWTQASSPAEWDAQAAGLLALAKKHRGLVVPVRPAWELGVRELPGLCWRNPDGVHPSVHQAYLAACLHYRIWTGQSPKGHPYPYVVDRGLRIDDRAAASLQDLADRVLASFQGGVCLPRDG